MASQLHFFFSQNDCEIDCFTHISDKAHVDFSLNNHRILKLKSV